MGPEQLEAIEALRVYAESNLVRLEEAKQRQEAGDHPIPIANCLLLEPALALTYTIDENPICEMRHLSVSYRDRLPNPVIVEELLTLFQFKNQMSDCIIYVEDGYAINVVEPREGGLFPEEIQQIFYGSRDTVSN